MDSPVISRLFRQLFSHQRCQALRAVSALPARVHNGRRVQARSISTRPEKRRTDANWQQRTDIMPFDMKEEFDTYPMLTADQLRGRKERPRRVKMLTRDFIEGTLKQSKSLMLALIILRFSLQSLIWILLETSSHLHTWQAIRFQ